VTVLGVNGNRNRIGVNVPTDVAVNRAEAYQRVQHEKSNQHTELSKRPIDGWF